MAKLFKLEIHKIVRQKSYYICLAVAMALLVLGAMLSENLALGNGITQLTLTAITDSSFLTLMGVFVAIFACDDYANGTIKNIYARGYSRSAVYFAKYLVSLLFTILAAIICFVTAMISGAIFNANLPVNWGQLLLNVVLQLGIVVGYHAVYFAISMVVTKMGGSIALNLLGPVLVMTILSIVCSLLKFNFNPNDYWFNEQINQLSNTVVLNQWLAINSVIMAVLYTVVFTVAGYLINRRKEV